MNIQIIRQKIREFVEARVSVYSWDLDYPDVYYYNVEGANYPANTAIEMPVQNILHLKDSKTGVKTSGRFPYRITYIFPSEMPFADIPFKALEGMLSWLHILSLIQSPDPAIEQIEPAELEDSITVARSDEVEGDWLVYINFAFDVVFRTTEFPDISDLQPPGYFPVDSPPPVNNFTGKINRAKPKFSRQDINTYTEDTVITIQP